MHTPGFVWRVGLSIAVFFGWIAFIILWLFFEATEYSVFQNLAIVLVSIIVAIGILAVGWATWGIRYASRFGHEPHRMREPKGAHIVSTIAGIGWLIFLVVWLFDYAGNYSGYQNLAVIILSLLVLGAFAGLAWVVRWMRIRIRGAMPPSAPPSAPPPAPPAGP